MPDMITTPAAAFRVFILVSIFLLPFSFEQYIEPRLCDGVCYCSRNEAVVDCSPQDRITGVPTNLPQGTQKLVIQGGHFPEPGHLSGKNLTGLSHLVSLRIVNSHLRSIESRAFLGMANLRDLDLSLNLLYRIEPHTFYGLNLNTLYLQKQRLQLDPYTIFGPLASPEALVMSTEAFYGLSAVKIDLHHNFISDISYSLFSKVNSLEKLILSNNRVRQLDPRFADHFDKSYRLLDLTDNLLECSCKLAWLVNRVKEWAAHSPSLKINCFFDPQAGEAGVELMKLTENHLCMGSKIQTIGVDLTSAENTATLSCTAVTFSRIDRQLVAFRRGEGEPYLNHPVVRLRPPSVAWKYTESGQLRQVTGMPADTLQAHPDFSASEKAMTTVQLNVSTLQTDRKFSCITWDEKENNQEILVTFRGPTLPPPESKDAIKESASTANKDTSSRSIGKPGEDNLAPSTAYSHSNFLFQKKYTLLEMIGAGIGTFLVTLVVLLVGSKCTVLLKNRAISSHPSKEIGRRSMTYDAVATKQSDSLGGVGNTSPLMTGSNNNNYIHALGCDGIVAAYPLYNHYLASASGVTYPTHITPTVSLMTNPTSGQIKSSSAATPLMQANMTMPALQAMQWPAPPGSTYSAAGSHEYDIPRAMEISQVTSDQATLQREHQHHHQQQHQPNSSHTMDAFGGDNAN